MSSVELVWSACQAESISWDGIYDDDTCLDVKCVCVCEGHCRREGRLEAGGWVWSCSPIDAEALDEETKYRLVKAGRAARHILEQNLCSLATFAHLLLVWSVPSLLIFYQSSTLSSVHMGVLLIMSLMYREAELTWHLPLIPTDSLKTNEF